MAGNIYGYVRVSTKEQHEDRQLIAMAGFAEGIAAAKLRGKKFGRKPKARPPLFATLRAAWEEKRVSAREAARQLAIDHHTFARWVKGKTE